MTEEQAVRQAVEQRIDSLDDSFIGAVRAFEVAARAQSLDDVAGRRSLRFADRLLVLSTHATVLTSGSKQAQYQPCQSISHDPFILCRSPQCN